MEVVRVMIHQVIIVQVMEVIKDTLVEVVMKIKIGTTNQKIDTKIQHMITGIINTKINLTLTIEALIQFFSLCSIKTHKRYDDRNSNRYDDRYRTRPSYTDRYETRYTNDYRGNGYDNRDPMYETSMRDGYNRGKHFL